MTFGRSAPDTLAGSWSASPASSYAEELVLAGLLLLARPVDGGGITERIREGFTRPRRALSSYDPSRPDFVSARSGKAFTGPDIWSRGVERRHPHVPWASHL